MPVLRVLAHGQVRLEIANEYLAGHGAFDHAREFDRDVADDLAVERRIESLGVVEFIACRQGESRP